MEQTFSLSIKSETTNNTDDNLTFRSKSSYSEISSKFRKTTFLSSEEKIGPKRSYEKKINEISPFEIFYPNNELHIIYKENEIKYLSLEKIIELLTHPKNPYPAIFDICLYGYLYFSDEEKLFKNLVLRYNCVPPINLSPSETHYYIINVIKVIQIKTLIFLENWVKLYEFPTLIKSVDKFDQLAETICNIFGKTKVDKENANEQKWVDLPSQKFEMLMNKIYHHKDFALNSLKNFTLFSNNDKKKFNLTELNTLIIFPIYNYLENNRKELAKSLCIFDFDNLMNVNIYEIVNKYNKNFTTPNLNYITEMFNAFSTVLSYLILYPKKESKRIAVYEQIIDLFDELMNLKNFNSSYSIYLCLTSSPIHRIFQMSPVGEKVKRSTRNKLEKFSNIFSLSNNQKNLRDTQNKAEMPCIPFLGVYSKDLLVIEETYRNDNRSNIIDIKKVSLLAMVIKRISIFRENKYKFSMKKNSLIDCFKYIPKFNDEYLYDLSCEIYPMGE